MIDWSKESKEQKNSALKTLLAESFQEARASQGVASEIFWRKFTSIYSDGKNQTSENFIKQNPAILTFIAPLEAEYQFSFFKVGIVGNIDEPAGGSASSNKTLYYIIGGIFIVGLAVIIFLKMRKK